MKRFLKGAFNWRQDRPKYNETWDPSIVLNVCATAKIALDALSQKLVTFIALVTGQRMQTFSLIKIKNIKFTGDSFTGDTLSKALEKSNYNKSVANFFSLPILISSVSLISAEWVLWYLQNPVWNGSKSFDLFKKLTTWSWASFSRTFDKKYNKAMGLKSDVDDGTGTFLRVVIQDFFQVDENGY